jgi:hypothetical protein
MLKTALSAAVPFRMSSTVVLGPRYIIDVPVGTDWS